MAGLFDTFLDAYTAPNQRAQEQQAYERAAPQRTADAWGIVNSQMDELRNPKPDMTSVEKYDPLTNPTSKLELPKEQRKLSPLEMQKAKLSAMISSGDPTLQKQALSMLPEYYKSQNTTGKAPGSKSTYGKQAEDMGYKYGTKDYYSKVDALQRAAASKSGVTINTGNPNALIPLDDLKHLRDPDGNIPRYGITEQNVMDGNYSVVEKTAADSAGKQSMMQASQELYPVVEDNLFKDGSIDRSMLIAMAAMDSPIIPDAVSNFAVGKMDPKAQEVYNAFETGMQAITRTETGAAMPPEEIVNTKKRFMPLPGDTDDVIMQKWKSYQYFIDNAMELLKPTGGNKPTPEEATKITNEAVEKSFAASGSSKPKPKTQANGLPEGVTFVD